MIRDTFKTKANMMVTRYAYQKGTTRRLCRRLSVSLSIFFQTILFSLRFAKIYGCHWLSDGYIFTGGSEKNAAIIYDRGTLKVSNQPS